MTILYWKRNRPRRPDPERPALPRAWRVIREGTQVRPAEYELDAICDDGRTRTFVSGPGGRWIQKEGTPCTWQNSGSP